MWCLILILFAATNDLWSVRTHVQIAFSASAKALIYIISVLAFISISYIPGYSLICRQATDSEDHHACIRKWCVCQGIYSSTQMKYLGFCLGFTLLLLILPSVVLSDLL